jgi:hypothetical protein
MDERGLDQQREALICRRQELSRDLEELVSLVQRAPERIRAAGEKADR